MTLCKSVCVLLLLSLASLRIHALCADGDVRVAGGPNQFEGRVEFCVNGGWRQVCSMGWTSHDAVVVCRQLGYDGDNRIHVLNDTLHGDGNDSLGVTNVQCDGDEQKLSDCSLDTLDDSTCSGYNGPAGVICQDPLCVNDSTSVRLSEDNVVEVCANTSGYRTGVCSNNWDDVDASVVCRQLNLGERGVASSTNSSVYRFRLAYENVACSGNEEKLSDCTHGLITSINPLTECSTGRFAQVQCEGVSTTDDIPVTATTITTPVETITKSMTTGSDTTTDVKLNPTTGGAVHPEQTTEAGSGQLSQSNFLLAIVLGVVGGLIALLLCGIIMLLVVIVLGRRRRKYSLQYLDNNTNGNILMTSTQVKTMDSNQVVNSYASQKGDPERLLLNPLYLQNQHQMANTNPLPYSSVLTPPSTAGVDPQIHDYATLDNFQSTHCQPQEYSAPVTPSPVIGCITPQAPYTEAANAYSEPAVNEGNYRVGEDGVLTDLQGYATLDPTAHTYECPQANAAAASGGEDHVSTLHIPQPYETPFESSYEDASSTTMSRASTPLSERSSRDSPERRETIEPENSQREEKINPYTTSFLKPEIQVPGSHNYATLESPK